MVLADVLAVLVALAVLTASIALIVLIAEAIVAAGIVAAGIVVEDTIAEAVIVVAAEAIDAAEATGKAVSRFQSITKISIAYEEEKGPYNGCRGSSLQQLT